MTTRVICLGEILFDCLADQKGRSLEEVESWTAYPGGAPANVACALVKLGTSAGFMGCVGEDAPGQELVALLESLGVNSMGIQKHPTAPTRQVYVLRSETGDRTFAGFGDCPPDEFADAYLQKNQLPEQLWKEADFLVLGTLELAYPQTREAIFYALELAQQYDVQVMLDVNWRPMFWHDPNTAQEWITKLWQFIDFLKLSDEEAQWLFETTDAGTISRNLDSVKGVLVTAGGEGEVSYCFGEHQGQVSPFLVDVQDTTGAGDGFVAGFLHQLCQQGTLSLGNESTVKQMVTYACAVGGLTATQPGAIAAQPTSDQVEVFLNQS